MDRYLKQKQGFVIRLKENVHLVTPRALRQWNPENAHVKRDITCLLGTPANRPQKRHRLVFFEDGHGHDIRVLTNLMHITAEEIVLMYKARWQIELFFRWIKQYLNIPTQFGTTENVVYGQLFSALIVYVLLKTMYDRVSLRVLKRQKDDFKK
ncbi:transposase [Paenibacillus sp. NPDC055715]